MKIGIICACDVEINPFLPIIEDCKVTQKVMLQLYEGKINNIEVVVVRCGVCKVNAAIATQVLIDSYGVDAVINSGTAGGMDTKLQIFDTVIATEVAYHDVSKDILTELHPFMETNCFASDDALLKAAKKTMDEVETEGAIYFGRMVTGEYFITDEGRERINDMYEPLSVDMETAAIAHVCYVNKIPFISVRSITDTAEHSGVENFDANCEKASIIAKDITVSLLKNVLK